MASRSLLMKMKWQRGRQGFLVLALCIEAWHDRSSVDNHRYFFLFGNTASTKRDPGLRDLQARLVNVELPML